MAGGTHFGVPPTESFRIKPRSMGIEPSSANRRMARETIPLDVTSDTTLKRLSCRRSMPGDEEALRVVETGVPKRRSGGEPGLLMARGAKLSRIVAIGAGGFPPIGVCRVTCQERCGMEPCCSRRIREMTCQALVASVTRKALGWSRGRRYPVLPGELGSV